MTAVWMGLTVAFPLLLAAGCTWTACRARLPAWLPWAPLPGLGLALFGGDGGLVMPWLMEGALWGLDERRRMLLAGSALVWAFAGLQARRGFPADGLQPPWLPFWLLSMAGNLGLYLARDLVGFYSFFSLMTIASYGLVTAAGGKAARRAGAVTLAMTLAGEMAVLGGLLLVAAPEGLRLLEDIPLGLAESPWRGVALALLLGGFGVKAGLPLLHLWMPLAYTAAPAPAAAALAGAMLNAGLFGWLAVLPLGELALPGWGAFLLWLGLLAAFGGAALGLCQRRPGALLAWSSISQVGLMTTVLGAGLAAPDLGTLAAAALSAYALHHGLAKGALFLAADAARRPGKHRMLALMALALPALSLGGLLFTPGAAVKGLAAGVLEQAAAGLPAASWAAALLPASAVATSALMLRLFVLLRHPAHAPRDPVPAAAWLGACVAAVGVFWLLPLPGLLPEGWTSYPLSHPLDYLWPPLAAGLLALATLRSGLRVRPGLAENTLMWLLFRLWRRLRDMAARGARRLGRQWERVLSSGRSLWRRGADWGHRLDREGVLRGKLELGWTMVLGALLLALLLPLS